MKRPDAAMTQEPSMVELRRLHRAAMDAMRDSWQCVADTDAWLSACERLGAAEQAFLAALRACIAELARERDDIANHLHEANQRLVEIAALRATPASDEVVDQDIIESHHRKLVEALRDYSAEHDNDITGEAASAIEYLLKLLAPAKESNWVLACKTIRRLELQIEGMQRVATPSAATISEAPDTDGLEPFTVEDAAQDIAADFAKGDTRP